MHRPSFGAVEASRSGRSVVYKDQCVHGFLTHTVLDLSDLRVMCGKTKVSLNKEEQWITVMSLDTDDFTEFRWCRICSNDPLFQLKLLAAADLGDI
jgi:hypothetical protein